MNYESRKEAYDKLRTALNEAVLGVGLFNDVMAADVPVVSGVLNPFVSSEIPVSQKPHREPKVLEQMERVQREVAELEKYHKGHDMPAGIADRILGK